MTDPNDLRSLTALDSPETVREALREAADEIERLRADLTHQTERAEGYSGWVTRFEEELALLNAVADQLRRFRDDWHVTPKPAMEALAALDKHRQAGGGEGKA